MLKTPAIEDSYARPLAWASSWAARLLLAQQEPTSLSILYQALNALEPLSNFIVFEFSLDHQPELIECNYERDYMLAQMAQYQRGLYLLDPFWRTVVEGRSGLVRLEDIAPEDFSQSEYFQRHYQATGVVDELRYIVPLKPGRSVHVLVEREIDAWVGGMLETGIGRASCLALASMPGFTLTPDLSASSRYFASDITAPFSLHDGVITVPTGLGIGVVPLESVLADECVVIETLFEH